MRLPLTLLLITLLGTCGRAQQSSVKRELLYVHTDRSLYEAGQTVFFRAYLTDGLRRLNAPESDVVHLELLAPNGNKIDSVNVYRGEKGHAGYLRLRGNLAGGRYTLRAYTNWLGNFGPASFFTKYVYVQSTQRPDLLLRLEPRREAYGPGDTVRYNFTARDRFGQPVANQSVAAELLVGGQISARKTPRLNVEGKAVFTFVLPPNLSTTDVRLSGRLAADDVVETVLRAVPVVLDQINLHFFPEGGHRVAGARQKIAFRATDLNSRPADVSGQLLAGNRPLLEFRSTHNGYGHFVLPPGAPDSLLARLDRPTEAYFPLSLPRTSALEARLQQNDRELLLESAEPVTLRLYRPDSVFYEGLLTDSARLDVSRYPAGVYAARLTDTDGRTRWERLFFLRPPAMQLRQIHYLPAADNKSDSVKFRLETAEGVPLAGSFSLAVVDDARHTLQNDKQPHLVSQLLLQSELRGRLYEPNDYFDPEQPTARAALDDVILCHGWRAIDWSVPVVYPALQTGLNGFIVNRGAFPTRLKISGERVVSTKGEYYLRLPRFGSNSSVSPDLRYHQRYNTAPLLPVDTLFQPTVTRNGRKAIRIKMRREERTELTETEQDLGQISVRGSRSNTTDFSVDGILAGEALGVELEVSANLDEVVVVGYGQVMKASISGSISVVTKDGANDYSILQRPDNGYQREAYFQQRAQPPVVLQEQRIYANGSDLEFPQYYSRPITNHLYRWLPLLPLEAGQAAVDLPGKRNSATHRLVLEGLLPDGTPVHLEETYSTKADVELSVKVPDRAVVGDTLLLTATVRNNLEEPVKLREYFTASDNLWELNPLRTLRSLGPGESRRIVRGIVVRTSGPAWINWGVYRRQTKTREGKRHKITTVPRYFTHGQTVIGSGEAKGELGFSTVTPQSGLVGTLSVYGNLVAEITAEQAEMLRAPYGCFEQTVSTAYPSALLLALPAGEDDSFAPQRKKAAKFLQQGISRMRRFQVPGNGYSLWSGGAAQPRYSAYALHFLADAMAVDANVPLSIITEARKALRRHLDTLAFAAEPDQAHFLLALLRHDETGLAPLLDKHLAAADLPKADPLYRLLVAQAALAAGHDDWARPRVPAWVEAARQSPTKSSASLSLSYSYGDMLQVERLGWLLSIYVAVKGYDATAGELLVQLRELAGKKRWISTQARVQYLRALAAVAPHWPQVDGGTLSVSLNGSEQRQISFAAGQSIEMIVPFSDELWEEDNVLSFRYTGGERPPFFRWRGRWEQRLPEQPTTAPLRVRSAPLRPEAQLGDIVRWEVVVENLRDTAVFAPMLQLGLPSNVTLLLKDLDPLVERGVITHYELAGGRLNLYFDELAAGERRTIPLDLKAEFPGLQRAPASVVYPYYSPNERYWLAGASLTVYP